MSVYTDKIRQWAIDNRRAGSLRNADGIGEVGLQSDEIGHRLAVRFMLKVDAERVADARYEVFGCGFSMAACAVAADLAVGYRLKDIARINADSLDQALDGLPSDRMYCADLAIEALHAAAKSALDGHLVETSVSEKEEHGPKITAEHAVYRYLQSTPSPSHISNEDRHLFACLLSIASEESCGLAAALGIEDSDIDSILMLFFPGSDRSILETANQTSPVPTPSPNQDVLKILYQHVPDTKHFNQLFVSYWFARIIATRASLPGHLWVALGLTERPQLTAAIRRHLPSLAEANSRNMRWKRYLFKQVCDLNGGVMCKAPNCGECSDYHLCFAEEH